LPGNEEEEEAPTSTTRQQNITIKFHWFFLPIHFLCHIMKWPSNYITNSQFVNQYTQE
jgi:hypothetical protein